jgi:hypothetical protein
MKHFGILKFWCLVRKFKRTCPKSSDADAVMLRFYMWLKIKLQLRCGCGDYCISNIVAAIAVASCNLKLWLWHWVALYVIGIVMDFETRLVLQCLYVIICFVFLVFRRRVGFWYLEGICIWICMYETRTSWSLTLKKVMSLYLGSDFWMCGTRYR